MTALSFIFRVQMKNLEHGSEVAWPRGRMRGTSPGSTGACGHVSSESWGQGLGFVEKSLYAIKEEPRE